MNVSNFLKLDQVKVITYKYSYTKMITFDINTYKIIAKENIFPNEYRVVWYKCIQREIQRRKKTQKLHYDPCID